MTAISTFLIDHQIWIQLIGLVFWIYLGIKTIIKKDNDIEFKSVVEIGLLKDYFSTLILTITNPITILFFIAVFAGLGLSNTINGFYSVMQLIIGVFIGSCIWWLFLSGLTNKLKTSISKNI